MTFEQWKALAALALEENKVEEWINSNLKNESGDVVDFEGGFPKLKGAVSDRMKSRLNYGLKTKGTELSQHIAKLTGIEPEEGEFAEKHIERAFKSVKEQASTKEFTKEDLLKNALVQDILKEAKSGTPVLTKDLIVASPIYQELARNIALQKEQEYKPQITTLTEQLNQEKNYRTDSELKANIAVFIDDARLNYGSDENSKQKAANTLFKLAKAENPNGYKNIDGNFYPINAAGNPVSDDSGFPVSFKKFMLDISPYAPHKTDPNKGGIGVSATGTGAKTSTKGMTEQQVLEEYGRLNREGKTKEASELMDAFEATLK